jgi:hypothetical protein
VATLTTIVTESLTLNGTEYGGTNTKTFTVSEISKRIVTVTVTEAEILKFGSTIDAGRYIIGDVRYMRFTNRDGTNFITLTFRNEDNDEVAIKLDAGQSFIWNADNTGGLVDVFNSTQAADVASSANLADLTSVQADANTGSCELEMLIASV